MSVLIKRNTGWMGTASNFQIQVSGEKVASVMNHQHIQINLQDGAARLQASQFGIKSNEIKVKNGDTVELTSTWISRFSFLLIMIPMLFTIFIPSIKYRIIAIICLSVFNIVCMVLIEGFHLKVLAEESRKEN